MKGFICCIFLSFFVVTGYSQKVYFMYLQSDSNEPFFLKLNDKVTSSSSSGYLILSKLRDSAYSFTIGFPQNKYPEQQFKISMDAKDHGFLLKNFTDKGWGLYDLESLAIHMAIPDTKAAKVEMKDVSEFTEILSKASDDPSLKERPVQIKKEEQPATPQAAVVRTTETQVEKDKPVVVNKAPDPVPLKQDVAIKETPKQEAKEKPATVNKLDSAVKMPGPVTINNVDSVVKKQEPVATIRPDTAVKKSEPVTVNKLDSSFKSQSIPVTVKETTGKPQTDIPQVAVAEEYKNSKVRKKSESSTVDGLGITYIDEYPDGKKDTIKIMIANASRSSSSTVTKPTQQEDKKFLDITSETKDVTPAVKPPVVDSAKNVKTVLPNNCNSVATDNDFLKLRKKMAATSSDDDMVSEAAKSFKSKCYTVEQLKNLGTLFLNDAGKYKFFDAAYMHVSDPDRFASLQSELKDEYYINRFKAMLR